jgi:hypothetical protein
MKRERLEEKTISRSAVDAVLEKFPWGRWVSLVAQDVGVTADELLKWLQARDYRVVYSNTQYKWSVYAKTKRERL